MGLLNKRSWQFRLREFFQRPRFLEENLDELEDLLLEADIAPTLAMSFGTELRRQAVKLKLQSERDLLLQLSRQLEGALRGNNGEFERCLKAGENLQVVMLLGVNGVGKTTSLAKLVPHLAEQCGIAPSEMTIGAGDTFRAAAIEQLKVHGERLGVRVVAEERGSDSAAVIYNAVSSALVRKHKLVLLDTAGRMHTKKLLLEELGKINRVLDRLIEPEQRYNLLVIDATTGKNALSQAEAFSQVLPLHGAIVTKMDAKCGGGIVFSLTEKLGLPVLYEGQGEKYGQIATFEPETYVRRLLGMES
ncbi:signal recognition particle-docking protein FtsY [Candidatus Haliotispira prima]|uniref:Signal recognition particle-docking protein FtsY n=1 Tax=Candidatus Haliotispira prima TaxID=3034016 RepID=A0ABY8MJU8_9SPIO|nr:signal recognition particle-docking protein FtsY [Candidatus Haliotispira prima]